MRLFARAAFADRLVGDEFARATIAELQAVDGALLANPVASLRALVERWREAFSADAPAPLFSDAALIEASGEPPSPERMVLLLRDMLGFRPDETARILALAPADVRKLLETARARIASPREGSAVVIEDEPLIAADLEDLLTQMGVRVLATARTVKSGVAASIAQRPDIVLADSNLHGDETCLHAVAAISEVHACRTIFITGFADRVLSGDGVEPDFVIVKPYSTPAVRAAVAQCLDIPPRPWLE